MERLPVGFHSIATSSPVTPCCGLEAPNLMVLFLLALSIELYQLLVLDLMMISVCLSTRYLLFVLLFLLAICVINPFIKNRK